MDELFGDKLMISSDLSQHMSFRKGNAGRPKNVAKKDYMRAEKKDDAECGVKELKSSEISFIKNVKILDTYFYQPIREQASHRDMLYYTPPLTDLIQAHEEFNNGLQSISLIDDICSLYLVYLPQLLPHHKSYFRTVNFAPPEIKEKINVLAEVRICISKSVF